MVRYIALCNFTDQGLRDMKNATKRADAVKEAAKKFDATVTHIYWTLGSFDIVSIIEAKDEISGAAFSLCVAAAGNIRMQSLRAFSKDEMNEIVDKLA